MPPIVSPPSLTMLAVPTFHTSSIGGGRQGPTEVLADFKVLQKHTPVDKTSLKAPILQSDKLAVLINLDPADYDGWLSNRNAVIKLLSQGFVQSSARALDRPAAMDSVRDIFKEAFAKAPKMRELWRRVQKSLSTSPETAEANCRDMVFAIDKECIPLRANTIERNIHRRIFKIGEESIVEYLREVTTMAQGHMPESQIRKFFMVKLEEQLEASETSEIFDSWGINDVRDNVLEAEADLPADLEDLYDALRKRSSCRTVWAARNAPVKKAARTNFATPEGAAAASEARPAQAEANLTGALAAITAQLAAT